MEIKFKTTPSKHKCAAADERYYGKCRLLRQQQESNEAVPETQLTIWGPGGAVDRPFNRRFNEVEVNGRVSVSVRALCSTYSHVYIFRLRRLRKLQTIH